jgi:hypothetical protein
MIEKRVRIGNGFVDINIGKGRLQTGGPNLLC